MLREVERELLRNAFAVDGGRNFSFADVALARKNERVPFALALRNVRLALVEHRQNGIIDIVVEEDDALLGRADKVGNKGVGIENLAVEEDALCGCGVFIVQSLENLPNLFVSILLVCGHPRCKGTKYFLNGKIWVGDDSSRRRNRRAQWGTDFPKSAITKQAYSHNGNAATAR